MSQKTLNLCLERYNFVKFGETTKSSHTILCINNAYSVNSDKYRLTPTAIAGKHGDGYVFTLNYDFDRPLFTIVQKSYSLDGTSGNIVFEGIDPVSKGGSKYLRKVTVSPVKLSDGSYLLEVTNDEYLRIGTTGAALGDEDLESLNEKIMATGGIEKSVETVGGKQVLKLDAGGPSGAKEIVYFDVDPSDPPSGIYDDITVALSNDKEPVIRIDGAVYFYTAAGTDKYVFVGGYTKDAVGYTEIEVSDDDSVTSKSVDDKVFNMFLLYKTDPASPGDPPGDEDSWVCDANKHVITKDELVAAHADCRYFILNNDVNPDSNSRKYFAAVTNVSNSYVQLRFYMVEYSGEGAANFYQKTVSNDSEGRLYISDSYQTYLAGTSQAVLVSEPQSFNATQKAQGRDNIGAASASDVTALQSQVSSLSDVSAYSVKGEATVSQLNAGPSGIQAGWAYQLTDSGTLTDGTLAVVAGDTVAWDGTKWFPLVKSDYYATKTYAQNVAHSLAPEYNGTTGAIAGEIYRHGDHTYKCIENTSGDWDSSKFEEINIGDEVTKNLSIAESFVENTEPLAIELKTACAVHTGGFLNIDGTVSESVGWRYYTKSVKPGEVYDVQSHSGSNKYTYIFRDANNNVISYSPYSGPGTSDKTINGVVVPVGATSIAINNSNDETKFSLKRIYNNLNVTMKPCLQKSDLQNFSVLVSNSSGRSLKLNLSECIGLDISEINDTLNWTLHDNHFIRFDGVLNTSDSWSYYERAVTEGQYFKVSSTAGLNARLFIFTDDNGKVIYVDSDSSDVGSKSSYVTVPYLATKLIVNRRKNNVDAPFSSKKLEFVIEGKNLDLSSIVDKSSNNLYGKILVSCGDSITNGADMDAEGIISSPSITCYKRSGETGWVADSSNVPASYPYQIAARNNMILYKDAMDGSTIEDITNKHGFSKANGRYTALPDTIDYLTIWFGWNDNAYGTVGTITDNVNTTFYGAYNIVLPYLIDKYPYTKICLCVPFGTSADMRQAVRNLGNKWGLAVFDFYGPQTPLYYGKENSVGVDASIVTVNRAKFQANGAHPNFKGHRQLADMFEAFLRTI